MAGPLLDHVLTRPINVAKMDLMQCDEKHGRHFGWPTPVEQRGRFVCFELKLLASQQGKVF